MYNDHGLIMSDKNQCLGYLVHFKGHGIYDAEIGRVEITPEEAEQHNKLLDKMLVDGLDNSCEVGQYGSFYFNRELKQVRTFLGELVSDVVRLAGSMVTFERGGKVFRGRITKDHDLFNFRRVN